MKDGMIKAKCDYCQEIKEIDMFKGICKRCEDLKFTKEELEYLNYLIEKHRPEEHIAFRINNKLKELIK